jgi:hypothetical protein
VRSSVSLLENCSSYMATTILLNSIVVESIAETE